MRAVGIVANLNKPNAAKIAEKTVGFFKRYNIGVIMEPPLARLLGKPKMGVPLDKMADSVDIVIALGGDGTFLRTARIIQKKLKPILGVNLGGLGFLAEVTLDSFEKDLGLLIEGKYNIDYRMTLAPEVIKQNGATKKIQPALNDVVINKKAIARVINLSVYIDNRCVARYRADGVIIATPTGSTAYALSAGGPIVAPNADVILVVPICPHTLTHRPLVVPSTNKIKIEMDAPLKDVVLTVDGQVGVKLGQGDSVVVGKGEQTVPLVTFRDTSYFEVLRQKLNWGSI